MKTKNQLFDERRTAEAAAYMLFRAGGKLPHIKLMKLLYLAERLSLQRYGEPLTGDKAVAMPLGPVLSMTLELINGTRPSCPGGWEDWISDRANHMVELADPSMIRTTDDLVHLSDADLEVLQETWGRFGHMEKFALVNYTHEHLPEWQDPEGSSIPIPYIRIFTGIGMDDETAERLAARLEAQQNIAASFAT
ncbi:hypothetical protein AGMMS50256_37200 [Betaproteobacteria bacterium]|nr:hypothetical protein AGMMS50256_37200 [Betaproteobacteria bacterium]